MSFTTNIDGSIGGNSVLVFNSVNVCTDNVSCDNLSATNASIINLTTNYFEPSSIFSPLVEGTHGEFDNCSVNNLSILNDVSIVGNLDLTNISIQNASVSNDLSVDNEISTTFLSCFGNINCSNNISGVSLNISNDANISGRVGLNGIDFKRTPNDGGGIPAYLNVNSASLQMYLNYSMTFNRNNSGLVFMKLDYANNNVNMSNLSLYNLSLTNSNVSNMSVHNLSTQSVTLRQIEYRNNPAGVKSYVSVNSGSVKQFHKSSWVFQKDDEAGIVFMKIDYANNNVNMSNLSVYNLSLTNSNVSNMSVDNLSTNLLNNISAGDFITLTTDPTTQQLVITGQGGLNSSNLSLDNLSVSDSLTSVKMNVSNLSVDNLSTDLLNNISAGNNITLSTDATTNKIVITGAGTSVSGNVSVSDFVETITIMPSGTLAFPVQGINQTSNFVTCKESQDGADYTSTNMVQVNAGDKMIFTWKQSAWKQSGAVQASINCYLISGTAPPSGSNRTRVGRIYSYVYPHSDHEDIVGTFIYVAPSSFQFYRSQMVVTGGLVTQGQDYGSATCTIYRATIPNKITIPNLLNVSNMSVDNLSTNLLNNLSAGENISLTTDPITQQIVITGQGGGLNSSNLSLDNLSVSANINVSNLSIAGDTDMKGKLVVGDIEFQQIGSTAVVSYLQTNMPSMKWYLKKTMDFRKDDGNGIVFMKLNHDVGNVNISNLSNANLSVDNVSVIGSITTPSATITDLTISSGGTFNHNLIGSITEGANMSIVSVLDKPRIGLNPDINISNMSVDNISCYGIIDVNRINASTLHAEELNVSGSAPLFTDGLNVYGSTTTQNISTGNISSGFITSDGDIRSAGGFRALGGSGIISTGAIQFNNANDGTGDSLEIYYTGTQFGMGTTSGKDFTINAGYSTGGLVVDGTINNINMSNCSINNLSADNISSTELSLTTLRLKDNTETTKSSWFVYPTAMEIYTQNDFRIRNQGLAGSPTFIEMDTSRNNVNISNLSSTNTSILNDMTITRDLDVDRYLSYKPRFLTRWRDNVYNITGTAQDVQWNRDETAMSGGALQVSGDGIQALLAGWYRVDWSVGYRKINNNDGERLTARTYLRINNVFYGKYGFGSTTYLRSSSINRIGFSSGSQLVYANANDIIHVRTDCIIQANVDFTSDFGGQRILASSRFSCEYVSNSGET